MYLDAAQHSLVATLEQSSPQMWNIHTSLSLGDEIWMVVWGRNGVGTKTGRASEWNKWYGIIYTHESKLTFI